MILQNLYSFSNVLFHIFNVPKLKFLYLFARALSFEALFVIIFRIELAFFPEQLDPGDELDQRSVLFDWIGWPKWAKLGGIILNDSPVCWSG